MALNMSSRTAAVATADRYDVDRLLAGYRAARAQEALFDVRNGPGAGYDEFVDADGNVRPAWTELADAVAERGRAGLDLLRSVVDDLPDDGSKLQRLEPGPWTLDTLPLVVSATDWEVLEAGLVQRSRLLDAVLADL